MEKQKFLIVWLKKSAGAVCYLHSDKKFYRSFISCRGCNLVTYKTAAAAEKKAQKYAYNTDGVIIALNAADVEQLESDWRNDAAAVLARYTDPVDLLPAFEDAQPDENGVITCRIRSASSMPIRDKNGARLFVVLLSWRDRDINDRNDDVLIIAKIKDYDNNGKFSGRPVFVIRPGELPNVTPRNLFGMLDGNETFAAKLSGAVDWETRAEWLAYFTDEEKRAAVQIEKHLQTLTNAAA